jgi:transposase
MKAMEVFMTKKTRRRFSDEFKADAVSLVIDQGYSVSEAARRLGVERSVLDRWCRKHRQQVSGTPGRQEDDRDAELKKLREEVRKLQIEKDILKKAAAFFAKESS